MGTPLPPQGAQQPFTERPLTVFGEPYVEGQPIPIGAVVNPGDPPVFTDGLPRVYLPTEGWHVLQIGEWVITHRYTGQVLAAVSAEEFTAQYEPPRPLQEIEGTLGLQRQHDDPEPDQRPDPLERRDGGSHDDPRAA